MRNSSKVLLTFFEMKLAYVDFFTVIVTDDGQFITRHACPSFFGSFTTAQTWRGDEITFFGVIKFWHFSFSSRVACNWGQKMRTNNSSGRLRGQTHQNVYCVRNGYLQSASSLCDVFMDVKSVASLNSQLIMCKQSLDYWVVLKSHNSKLIQKQKLRNSYFVLCSLSLTSIKLRKVYEWRQ